jgi:hypothetical protein
MRTPVRLILTLAVMLATSACAQLQLQKDVFLGHEPWDSFWGKVVEKEHGPEAEAKATNIEGTNVHKAIRTAVQSLCNKGKKPDNEDLEIKALWPSDFKELLRALTADMREGRYALKAPEKVTGSAAPATPGEIDLPKLLAAYLSAYFSGTFVDRNGGTYAKPTFGTTIPDATITGFAVVMLEALIDEEVLLNSKCVYYPIYYTVTKDKVSFLTNGNKVPTLAKVIYQVHQGGNTNYNPSSYNLDRIVVNVPPDPAGKQGKETNATQKLAIIRYFGGLTGSAAQVGSGLIVGGIGGLNVGLPVVLGKLSFGDNKVLSNLVETAVETIGRGLTEAAVSNALGGPDQPPPEHLWWIWVGAGSDPAPATPVAPGPPPGGAAPATQ